MSDDEDPEVIADMQLRARTERDATRNRGQALWTRPAIVEHWPCRLCHVLVAVTSEGLGALATFNRDLTKRGEPLLDAGAIAVCDECRLLALAERNKRLPLKHARVAELIHKLKASRNPEGETELLTELRRWGHPDLPGLIATCRARFDGPNPNAKRPAKGER